MPVPKTTDFIDNDPVIYRKYYLDGTVYNPNFSKIIHKDTKPERILNQYFWDQKVIHEEPALIVSRHYLTWMHVYEVQVEQRCTDTEWEFVEIESMLGVPVKELWRCFFRSGKREEITKNPPMEDITISTGNFFAFPYKNLDELIENNLIQGWTRVEVISSIKRLLALDLSQITDFRKDEVEQLRDWVKGNPEVLQPDYLVLQAEKYELTCL